MPVIITKVPILDNTRRWECPSCHKQHVTNDSRPITPMHPCAALKGLTAPFAEVKGLSLKKHDKVNRVIEREDFDNGEIGIMKDADGKSVMAIQQEHDGGYDTWVFPSTAKIVLRTE